VLFESPLCSSVNVVLQSVARVKDENAKKDLENLNKGLCPVRLIGGDLIPGKRYFGFQHIKLWPAYEPILIRLNQLTENEFSSYLVPYFTGEIFSNQKLHKNTQIMTKSNIINMLFFTNMKIKSKNWSHLHGIGI
jgi:hypothetical protein